MMKTRTHPETGQSLSYQRRTEIVRYGSFAAPIELWGWYPESEGDALFEMKDLEARDALRCDLRDRYIAHLKDMRAKAGLTQEMASHLIGGGPRAFQKYESGKAVPTDAAIGLIELVFRDVRNVDILRDIRKQPCLVAA